MSASIENPWLAQDSRHLSSSNPIQECSQSVSQIHAALELLDRAGSRFTESLVKALEQTAYRFLGEILEDKLRDVFTAATSDASVTILQEMGILLAQLLDTEKEKYDIQTCGQMICQVALLFTKLKSQYYSLCHGKMSDLVHSLLCLKGEDAASAEVTKLILTLKLGEGFDFQNSSAASLPSISGGSVQLKKSSQDSQKSPNPGGYKIMPQFEQKTAVDETKDVVIKEPKSEGTDAKREGIPTLSVTTGSYEGESYISSSLSSGHGFGSFLTSDLSQATTNASVNHYQFKSVPETPYINVDSSTPVFSTKSQLATEEELESVINLLSGVGYGSVSPMQVIPEVVPPQDSMQLTVPQIYRTLSPVSDTQLEERRKSQVHRRSEGCLDLSAMGRNMWPHQHQYHHRASLPSVQIFSAAGHRSGYDRYSPVPPYIRDSPSPNYRMSDPPSPGYFHGDPPSPFRTHYAKTLGVGMGAFRPNMLSPLQWSSSSPSNLMGSHLSSLDPGQHGAWPRYGGVSPVSPSVGETSNWVGTQDGSDLSDDSSTEDQFFAVGKDLSHMISSKHGSSDEEVDSRQPEMSKSCSPWPPPHPHSSSSVSKDLAPELLEPPDVYSLHKPIQMQWSDPLSSRSVWQPSAHDASLHKTSQSMHGFGDSQ